VNELGRDIAAISIVKAAVIALALFVGFRAVSDDDFARVVIAEQWAGAPRLDPSGTSWLPFPFWVSGAAMALFGRSLDVARAVAITLGVGSAAVVYMAARWLTGDRRAALLGAVIAAVFPWSARLGAATVPELPTAALLLLAMASLSPPASPVRRLWGGAALFAATLSRYETWPVAGAFAVVCVVDWARRAAGERRASELYAAALALLGPVLWVVWNRVAHGDALHFLARVTAYRKALGGDDGGAAARLYAYPLSMLREEPELCAGLLLALLGAVALGVARDSWRRFARPLAMTLVQIAALSVAMVKDGAPTHHPERAVLSALLLMALFAGDAALRFARAASLRARSALGACCLLAMMLGPLWVRRWFPGDGMSAREDEVAIGHAAREVTRPGEKVLVEVVDYGYFAVVAALGRPEDAVLDRTIDPREPRKGSSFDEASALAMRLRDAGARGVIGRVSTATRAALGEPEVTRGAWGLWRGSSADKVGHDG